MENTEGVEEFIVFTDNCLGQIKNWQMIAFWLQLVNPNKFNKITHYFVVSGNTHLLSDCEFAKIEKRQREHTSIIYAPEGWIKVIKETNKKKTIYSYSNDPKQFLLVSTVAEKY